MSRKWSILVSSDAEGKHPVYTLDFGVVNENNEKTLTLYIRNLENYRVFNIDYIVKSKDVQVDGPLTLDKMGSAELKISWSVGEETVALKDVVSFKCEMLKE